MAARASPKIMGILNCTPDSFSDGGRHSGVAALSERALRMAEEGADIIDVGGESTRPGAQAVPESAELERVLPVIAAIRRHSPVPISIDTTKARVAKAAIEAGASLINDVSALERDPEMAAVAAEAGIQVVLMHSRGTPQTMQGLAQYADVVEEVRSELKASVARALNGGILPERIIVDPGFGFAKDAVQNVALLKNLSRIKSLGYPVVAGLSRKSFIGKITGRDDPADRLYGSLAGALVAAMNGADILRVHDVAPTREVLSVLAETAS